MKPYSTCGPEEDDRMVYSLRFAPEGDNPETVAIEWGTGQTVLVPLTFLPTDFLDWQLKMRVANLRFFLTGQGEHDFAVHVGYMATLSPGDAFPLNVAAKGFGLLPAGELDKLTTKINTLIERTLLLGAENTRKERIEFLISLYTEIPMNKRVLTTLELYGKQTWRNILHDPRCSVLFSSYRNTSFAVNGVVQVLSPGSPEYEYIVAVHDLFHPPQKKEPKRPLAAYKLWVSEVYLKTPGPRAGERLS